MKPTVSEITDKWIKDNAPCQGAFDWWDKKERFPLKILDGLIEAKHYAWANWFIVRVMTYHDYVSYAAYAAKQAIGIYDKKYPDDKRPRLAIEAAERCIENPTAENKKAADAAAYAAADAAAHAAADAVMRLKILEYGMKLLRSKEK